MQRSRPNHVRFLSIIRPGEQIHCSYRQYRALAPAACQDLRAARLRFMHLAVDAIDFVRIDHWANIHTLVQRIADDHRLARRAELPCEWFVDFALAVILLGLCFQALGLQYPVALALIGAIGWLIPWVGVLVAVIPAALAGLAISPGLGVLAAAIQIIAGQLWRAMTRSMVAPPDNPIVSALRWRRTLSANI